MSEVAESIFFEVFEGLPRQGPGSRDCVRRALALCGDLPKAPRILDLGCGAGAQTLHLAELTAGTILAVDLHAPLVETLLARVRERGLEDRVEARVADMGALDLDPEFDLVWSEGALYNVGLARGLPLCAGLLRPGGHLAFTEAVWLSDDPPADVREAFADYSTMGAIEDALAALKAGGWTVHGHFVLPEAAWWDHFYTPMLARISALRAKYAGDAAAQAALDEVAREPAMHRASGQHYGYCFFVAQRPS